MTRTYLWGQVWPWYLPTFPFDQFEHLEGSALTWALQAFAREWAQRNARKLAAARKERRRNHRLQSAHQPHPPGRADSMRRPQSGPVRPRAPSFEEVALAASWAIRPCGLVFHYPVLGALQPIPKIYFHATDDPEVAEGILDALRCLNFPRPIGNGFGRGQAIFRGGLHTNLHAELRLGMVGPIELGQDRTRRVLIERELERFAESSDQYSRWAVPLADEAVRIERLLLLERTPADASKPKRKTGSPTADNPGREKQVYDARKAGRPYAEIARDFGLPVTEEAGRDETWDALAQPAAGEASGSADRLPLSDQAQAMYEVLCSLPETRGRTAKQLVQDLEEKGCRVDEDRVRRLAQELKPYGIQRTRAAGYHVPVSRRLKAPGP